MTSSIVLLVGVAALLLFILLNDTARKIVALLVLVGLAFSLGWFWPKATALRAVEASSPPPCASSF